MRLATIVNRSTTAFLALALVTLPLACDGGDSSNSSSTTEPDKDDQDDQDDQDTQSATETTDESADNTTTSTVTTSPEDESDADSGSDGDTEPSEESSVPEETNSDETTQTETSTDTETETDTTTETTNPDQIDCSALSASGMGIGEIPENVVLSDAGGNQVSLHDYCNQVVYVIAGTAYCSHCREEAARAAKILQTDFSDGSVKVFFLLSADVDGGPASASHAKAWDQEFAWAPHGATLADPDLQGFEKLWDRTGKDGAMVLGRGFVVRSIDPQDPKAAIAKALAE
jgi:hypothetical protein